MLLVEVERAYGGGILRRDHRDQHFELEFLLLLAGGEDLAAATEERIGGDVGLRGQAERGQQIDSALQPHVAPFDHFIGRTDANELAHPEGLHAGRLRRRLVAVDPVQHGYEAAALGHHAGEARVDGIAGGGIQHHVGDAEHVAPRLALVHALGQRDRLELLAEETVDRAAQVRKRVEVVDLFQHLAADDRREGIELGVIVFRQLRDQAVEALEDILEDRTAAECTLHSNRDDEAVLDQARVEFFHVVFDSHRKVLPV